MHRGCFRRQISRDRKAAGDGVLLGAEAPGVISILSTPVTCHSKMESSSEDNITTRSVLKRILETETVHTAVKNPYKRRSLQPSTSYAVQDENASPSVSLRSKMKERVRRSLQRSVLNSPGVKRKALSAQKRSLLLVKDADDFTPRTLLKNIIQTEEEASLIVSQRPKAAAADDGNPESSPTAQLSSVGNVSLSLPDLQDSGPVTILRKTTKRKPRVSEFERAVDERLSKNTDDVDNVSLDSFASSSSLVGSNALSRPFRTKLDRLAAPESSSWDGLLRRHNKVRLVSLSDFEKRVDDKYQLLKGSQECFIQLAEDNESNASSSSLALMNTELFTWSLEKDSNANKSENRKQRGASTLFLSGSNERKEVNDELLETEARKLNAKDHHAEENVIIDFSGDHADVIKDSYIGGDSEEDEADGQALGEVVDDASEGKAESLVSGEVVNDGSEDEADGHVSGEDEAKSHVSGEPVDEDSEDEADGHVSGEVMDDGSEDEAESHVSGEDEARSHVSGEPMDDGSEDEAEGHVSGEEAKSHVSGEDDAEGHASDKVVDDGIEDEADSNVSGEDESDGHVSGEDDAEGHASDKVVDDSFEDEADGNVSGEDESDGHISGEDESDGHVSGEDDAEGHALGKVVDDGSEDEADGHVSDEDEADGHVSDEADGHVSDEADGHVSDEADGHVSDEVEADGHVSDEDVADGHVSGEDESDGQVSDEDEADGHVAGEVEDEDVRVEGEVADYIMDDESIVQPNQSSLKHSNRQSAGVADYSHVEQRARLSTGLRVGNKKTPESIHLQTLSVSRPEEGSEPSDDESVDLALARGEPNRKNNQLIFQELPETPPYLKNVRFAWKDKPAVTHKKIQRTKSTKPKKSGSALGSSQVRWLFNHHAQMRVSKEALADAEECVEKYMDHLTNDLSVYSAHASRKTITRADMEVLLKRQRLMTDTTSLNVLIEKHLPMDCRRLLIPCAISGNQVFPKNVASSSR